ncbi:MAG TPA: TolC family protein [Ohtaekwangia sp.]|nr:TolC family protein [Ohtaekwangia sp.]
MKKIFFLSVALLSYCCTLAQDVDYNTIILPGNATNMSIEEKLVQLAWKNDPNNTQIVKQVAVAEYSMKQAQWNWLDYFSVRGNLNEFTIDPNRFEQDGRQPNFYPRYNFGVAFTLGSFGVNALEVKKRRVQTSMAEDAVKARKLAVRADILTRYARYQLAEKQYKIQKETTDQSDVNYKYVEQRFKDGQEDLQTYNNLLERNTNQQLRLAEVEAELKTAKLAVEQLIGTKLENVR